MGGPGTASAPRPHAMHDDDWRELDEEALQRVLIERWLYRGMMLGIMLLSAIVVTYLGLRGISRLGDHLTVGALLALALAAAVVAFTMRQKDLRLHRELRRRRLARRDPPPGSTSPP